MTKKRFKASDTIAFNVEAVEVNGEQFISIRKMYQTKGEPGVWKPGYQGITIPLKGVAKISAYATQIANDPDTEFLHVEPKPKSQPKEKKAKK
jgi:hypothetical protein